MRLCVPAMGLHPQEVYNVHSIQLPRVPSAAQGNLIISIPRRVSQEDYSVLSQALCSKDF